MQKEHQGTLSIEEEQELDRRMGNFYKLECFGQVYKINKCIIARVILASALLFMIFNIIYLVSIDL